MMALFESEEGGVFTALTHFPPPYEITVKPDRRFVLRADLRGEPALYVEQPLPGFQKRLTNILGNSSAPYPKPGT